MRVRGKNILFVLVMVTILVAMAYLIVNINSIIGTDITEADIQDLVTSEPVQADFSDRGTNPGAPVTFVEFSDFECPFCASMFMDIDTIINEYGDDINFVYKHLPGHRTSTQAAEAVECAKDQGRFFAMHDRLFLDQDHSLDNMETHAQDIGLDLQRYKLCMSAHLKRGILEQDIADARIYGVTGTPTFFINTQKLVGVRTLNQLQLVIDQELKNVGTT